MSRTVLDTLRGAARKSMYVVREEGPATWLNRAARIAVVRARRLVQDKAENHERWQAIRNTRSGERAFLIGNGPSLNRTPMHLLQDEQVMCFNRFHLMFERLAWRPPMYAISDDRVAFDIAEEVNSTVLPVVDRAFFPDIHPYNVDFRNVIDDRDNVFWLHLDRLDFSDELPYAGMNKTVANVGIQVLAFLGFNPIYLVGVDMSYSKPDSIVEVNARDWTSTKDDDPNHFDPRYFGSGSRYHAPRMDETRERYVRAAEFYGERGVRIVNAGVGGELDVFPREDFRSLFPTIDADQERALLIAAAVQAESAIDRDEIERAQLASAPGTELRCGWVPASECASRVTDLLRTHLVFGPSEADEYLLVARRSPAW